MDRMDYIQAVTRTRVLETKLLSRTRLERMVDTKEPEEILKILGETEYAGALAGVDRIEDYETILSSELKRVYKEMYDISKDKIVVDLMALKYDYHNLKVLVKEKLLEKDFANMYIPISAFDFEKIRLGFNSGDHRDMDLDIREALEAVEKDFEVHEDPQRIDIILDKYYFNHLYKLAKETGIPLFVEYVTSDIDFTNVKTLIRVKKQNKDINFLQDVIIENGRIGKDDIVMNLNSSIDVIVAKFKSLDIGPKLRLGLEKYEETGRLSEFERQMDNYLMDINKSSKSVNFGPEPIFSYIIAKETEVKALRIIIVSKLNKLSSQDIRERLRDLYV